MILVGKFTKIGFVKFIGHLDLVNLIEKAFKRAKIQVKYSEGFNPQPLVVIANPLPLGVESLAEYMEVETLEDYPIDNLLPRLNQELPRGIDLVKLEKDRKIKLDKIIKYMTYEIIFPEKVELRDIDRILKEIKEDKTYTIYRKKKRKDKVYDIPLNVNSFLLDHSINTNKNSLIYKTKSNIGGNLKAEYMIKVLNQEGANIDLDELRLVRLAQEDIRGNDII